MISLIGPYLQHSQIFTLGALCIAMAVEKDLQDKERDSTGRSGVAKKIRAGKGCWEGGGECQRVVTNRESSEGMLGEGG